MIRFTIVEKNSPRMMKRDLNKVVAEALKAPLLLWFNEILPTHFEELAKSKYKYTTRSRQTSKRKRHEHGHTRPLVNDGRLERSLRMGASIRTNSKRGRLTMQAPIYVNYKRAQKSGQVVDKRAEITAVSPKDMQRLEQEMKREMTRLLSKTSGPTEKRRV